MEWPALALICVVGKTRRKTMLAVAAVAAAACMLHVLREGFSGDWHPRVQLPDGPVLQIEGVTFGMNHRVGLELQMRPLFDSLQLRPVSTLHYLHPTLVVWLNALDPKTGKYVDLPQMDVSIVDHDGNLYYGMCHSGLSAANGFHRSGYTFEAFPRAEREMTLQLTTFNTEQTVRVKIRNPDFRKPVRMIGKPLPQTNVVGDFEVVLTGLKMRTNGFDYLNGMPVPRYWEPVWQLLRDGKPAFGWEAPRWEAEDSLGNLGRFLGVHEPVLRFSATVYPYATNTEEVVVLASQSVVALTPPKFIHSWNLEVPYGAKTISVLGLFPPGDYVFSEGRFVPGPASGFGPVAAGRSSGWESIGRRSSLFARIRQLHRHHTSVSTIYLRGLELGGTEHLAVRVRDDQGRLWNARLEPAYSDAVHSDAICA